MNFDRKFLAGFLLNDVDRVAADILPPHLHDIATALVRVQKQSVR